MYTSKKSTVFIFAICALVVSSCGRIILAASGESPSIELKDGQAIVNGGLGKTFHKKMERFIAAHPEVKDIVMEKVPGSVNDEWNTKTCVLIHENCMNTILNEDSEIASGGVDLFISGHNRIIAEGALIGVHSWSDGKKDGAEYPASADEHQIFKDFMESIDFDMDFYWYTLQAAPADSIHWMTADEIEKFGMRNELDSSDTCY